MNQEKEPLVQGGQGRSSDSIDSDGRIFSVSLVGAMIVLIVAAIMVFCFAGCERPRTTQDKIRRIFQ